MLKVLPGTIEADKEPLQCNDVHFKNLGVKTTVIYIWSGSKKS